MPDYRLLITDVFEKAMKIIKEQEDIDVADINTAGLGDPSTASHYNQPAMGLGTAVQVGPGPDSQLLADTANVIPKVNVVPELNTGFSLGGSNDPLKEEGDFPSNFNIGGEGNLPNPLNAPTHPPMASMPIEETDDLSVNENDTGVTFENMDALPSFEDITDDPALAALPVDASGIIEPIVVPDDIIVEPELGVIPDVVLPFEEPIIEISDDDVDVQIPDNIFENNCVPESIHVLESFKLPENQNVVISKGDQIFLLGHVREDLTPKFAESVFTRALKALCESKGGGELVMAGERMEKVALVGRSLLVEVAKDWRLPGTNIIFEAYDLLQIVSAKPLQEGRIDEGPKDTLRENKKASKINEELEVEKLKREAEIAHRRWKEAQKRKENSDDDDDEDDDDEDKVKIKIKKEKAKREAAFLERQKTGGYL